MPFILISVDREAADVGRGGHVGASAGLLVEGFDGDGAGLTVNDGRRDFERSQQLGAGAEFGCGEVVVVERMSVSEHGVDVSFELRAKAPRETFPFEVDTGVVQVDLRAGDLRFVVAGS